MGTYRHVGTMLVPEIAKLGRCRMPSAVGVALVAKGLLVCWVAVAGQRVHADTSAPRIVLGKGVGEVFVGPKMNVAGRDLRGTVIVGQDLTGAVFDGCSLFGVRLVECKLSQASFRDVNFYGGLVVDCPVDGADFTGARINGNGKQLGSGGSRCGLDLTWEQFESTESYQVRDLSYCKVGLPNEPKALDLKRANLSHAQLSGDLTACDFTGSDIIDTKFHAAIRFKQLKSAIYRELSIRVSGANLRGEVNFDGIDLERSEIMLIDRKWSFRNAKINGATLGGLSKEQLFSTTSYLAGNLTGITLHESDFSDGQFSKMNLTGTQFRKCDFTGATFDDAVITDVEFCVNVGPCNGVTGLTAAQLATTWNFKHNRMQSVTMPNHIRLELKAIQAGQSEE